MVADTKLDLSPLQGKNFFVLGLGQMGSATLRALHKAGIGVAGWDDSAQKRQEIEEGQLPISDPQNWDWDSCDGLILSPGIPRAWPQAHPVVSLAQQHSCPILCDLDLLAWVNPAGRYIGITGTNGKSTTTALLTHILRAAGLPAVMGGNIGVPALALPALPEDGYYVLEVSSYQLESLSQISWQRAIFLNLGPDHLDRYADMASYHQTKEQILVHLVADGQAVIGVDDEYCQASYERYQDSALPISTQHLPRHGYAVDIKGMLYRLDDYAANFIVDMNTSPALPGVHNWQNALAAVAVALSLGVTPEKIRSALVSFPGLPHRQQHIGTRDNILFINDSKATNPLSTARALACYRNIYWIAGGKAKPGGWDDLIKYLDRVIAAFLIGDAQDELADFLDDKIPYRKCGDLATAMQQAYNQARQDFIGQAVILLSPACASFDQYANFGERGADFVRQFGRLSQEVEA